MPSALRGELRVNEPMARHVSWRAGGAAQRAYLPVDRDDLCDFLRASPQDEPLHFVGLGSNLLVRDGGLEGCVIFTHWALRGIALGTISEAGGEIHVEGGVASPKVARYAALHGLVGAEFLAGIPGTIGGALAMNAGCYGGEAWNIVRSVVTVDRAGTLHERTPDHYRIGYRSVAGAPQRGGTLADEWFVSAVLTLPRGDGAQSRKTIKDLLAQRIASQPLGEPNAGSVFRNPAGTFAARLIEECGLKGTAVGGAVISKKHANFIVNTGNARAADIEALIEYARDAVRQKFGIELEQEVRIVGQALGESRQ